MTTMNQRLALESKPEILLRMLEKGTIRDGKVALHNENQAWDLESN